MIVDNYFAKQDENGKWMLWITKDGQDSPFEKLPDNYELMPTSDREALIAGTLCEYGISVLPRKKVFLKEPKKVILKLAKSKVYGYVLYLKGTSKCIYRMDEKGIYVMNMDNNPKTKPLYFTKEDLEMIGNIDEFDVKKTEWPGRYIRNKIK